MKYASLVLTRVASTIPTLVLATLIVFFLIRLIPGDPANAIAGEYATPERLAEIRTELGLDLSLPMQYLSWVGGVLTGDLGVSFMTGQGVAGLILERLPVTLILTTMGLVVAVLIGLPTGIISASRSGGRLDRFLTTAATLGLAIPNFWLGMVLILVFSVALGWLPGPGGPLFTADPLGAIRAAILPAIALGLVGGAEICRQVRSAMVEDLTSDHVRTHKAKGLSWRRILWVHSLKNSSLPFLTIVGLQISRLLSASVVVETVFGLSGLGTLIVTSTNQREYLIVQGVVLVMALLVIFTNLVVDIFYRVIDPRIR
ncbi:ABC transporter permease [Brevibacterium sp.]|jgi:peptide/nickel transport system permease protein|uniref:ABC transporter permease n=1 Tax=Brevibacterium sp. TaxID=1701 RepID=UPI0025B8628A|nr:ABC transporter permease [Brevibacterium sp.]